jgi:hypothetical protein
MTEAKRMAQSERMALRNRLAEYIDDMHRHAMPWCPDHAKGKCRSCADKVREYQQAKLDLDALTLDASR